MHDQGEDDDEFLSLGGLGGIATTGMGPGKVLDPPLKAPPKKRAKVCKDQTCLLCCYLFVTGSVWSYRIRFKKQVLCPVCILLSKLSI